MKTSCPRDWPYKCGWATVESTKRGVDRISSPFPVPSPTVHSNPKSDMAGEIDTCTANYFISGKYDLNFSEPYSRMAC